MPPPHERDPVSREVFDYFATQATKMLDGHEKDSMDHEKRIFALELESKASRKSWAFFAGIASGILSTAAVEGIKYFAHK